MTNQNNFDQMKQQLDTMVDALKKTTLPQQPQKKLYDLPWTFVLGAPESGKVELLEQAKLNFIFKKTFKSAQVPTQHCQCYATADTVFIDVNDRYMVQRKGHNEVRKTWLSFLTTMRTYRPRQVCDSLIFVIDINTLVTEERQNRSTYLKNLKARLKDLSRYLTEPVPFYLVISQMDRLSGLSEFFDDLSQQASEKAWGIPFHSVKGAQTLSDQFDIEFDNLLYTLNQKLIQRLHFERDLAKRRQIQAFPLQMESLKKPLAILLQQIASFCTEKKQTQLQGLYFCASKTPDKLAETESSTNDSQTPQTNDILSSQKNNKPQQISRIDQLAKPLAENFGIENILIEPSRKQPAFFSHGFFKLLAQKQTYQTIVKQNKKKSFMYSLQWYLLILGLILTTVVLTLWARSFSKDMNDLADIEQALSQYQLMARVPDYALDIQTVLPQLNKLATVGQTVKYHRMPWVVRHFLPNDLAVYQQSNQAFQALTELLVRRKLEQLITVQLKKANPDYSELYRSLKFYLMLSQPQHFDQQAMINFLIEQWQSSLKPLQIKQLKDYLQQTFATEKTLAIQTGLVAQARLLLNQAPKEKLADILISDQLSGFSPLVLSLPKINNQAVFASVSNTITIPAEFTAEAFGQVYQFILPQITQDLINGNWVTKNQPDTQSIDASALKKVQAFYLASYISTWRNVLANLSLKPFTSYPEAISVISSFSQANSQTLQLIFQISANTNVQLNHQQTPVSEYFQTFNQLTTQLLAQNNSNLMAIAGYLTTVAQAKNSAIAAFELLKAHQTLSQSQNDAFYRLAQASKNLPYPYQDWFNSILHNSWQLILNDCAQVVNQAWQLNVYQPFTQKLMPFYPFSAQAQTEVKLEDFEQFFNSEGTLQQFIDFYLAPFVNFKNDWQLKSFYGNTLPLAKDSIQTLQKLNDLSQQLFPSHQKTSAISFLLKPESFSANIKSVYVNINGQATDYKPNFMVATRFEWQPSTDNQVIMIVNGSNNQQQTLNFTGAWSLFRWIDALNPDLKPMGTSITYQNKELSLSFILESTEQGDYLPLQQLRQLKLTQTL